jgi:hypothetical protein
LVTLNQANLLNISSKIVGLEFELFQELGGKERLVYKLIGLTFLISLFLAALSGGYFFYLVDDHLLSIILGGGLFLFICGSTFRVLLSTNRKSMLEVGVVTKRWNKFLPSLSGLVRLYIVLIFSLITAFPLASFMNPSIVEDVYSSKLNEIEKKINSGAELLVLSNVESDLEFTHFPLATFERLIETGKIYPWFLLIFLLLFFQQVLLSVARNTDSFFYQDLATKRYLELSYRNYDLTLELAFAMAESKFKVDLSEHRDHLEKKGIVTYSDLQSEKSQMVYLKDEEKVKTLLQI